MFPLRSMQTFRSKKRDLHQFRRSVGPYLSYQAPHLPARLPISRLGPFPGRMRSLYVVVVA